MKKQQIPQPRTHEEFSCAVAAVSNGVRISCRVQPRASKARLCGLYAGAVKVSLTAPPVDGKANAALCEYLAGLCGVPKSAASVAAGQTSRNKIVAVSGVSRETAIAALEAENE